MFFIFFNINIIAHVLYTRVYMCVYVRECVCLCACAFVCFVYSELLADEWFKDRYLRIFVSVCMRVCISGVIHLGVVVVVIIIIIIIITITNIIIITKSIP